jgi:hypothetical protein
MFWYGNGYHVEGRRWTERLLECLDDVPLVYQPRFLFSAGHMAFLHELAAGTPLFRRALEVARERGDALQAAWALAFLGYTRLPEPEGATQLVEESLVLFRGLQHQPGVALALNILGEIARFDGDEVRAKRAYEECLAICQQTGERHRIVFMYLNLAYLAAHVGQFVRACELAHQGLHLARDMGSRFDMARALAMLAGTLGVLGQPRQAVLLLGASERALEQMGAFQQMNDKQEIDMLFVKIRTQLDEETFRAAMADGRTLTLMQAVAEALDEENGQAANGVSNGMDTQ